MRIMTFNLRFANPLDGDNAWEHRKELVAEVILKHRPDLLGTQEGTVPQLEFLEGHLPGYQPLTAHRDIDRTCQYPTIFYRREGFTVQDSGEFWLSETPMVHRSLSWDSAFPRMVTYGLFQEAGRSEWFYFADTHLDHISGLARLRGARLIKEFFLAQNRPFTLAGDFNEAPEGPVYQELEVGVGPLQDSWRAIYAPGQEMGTQHGFSGQPLTERIDWILLTPPFKVKKAAMVADNKDGRYPSDHFPYEIEVEY